MANSYAERARRFYAWYAAAVEASLPAALVDYRHVRQFCVATSVRAEYRLLLTQFMAAKVDPYKYLDRYLLPGQIEEALRLPLRSKEQVDYIIAAADHYGACDDELRSLIYRLFEVEP